MAGILYVVATPIGNLEDMTYRAVRILGEVARIACEDTRQTRKLVDHFGIHKPLVSYHDHNEAERTAQFLAELEAGSSIALVSDAGTPLISDPGYRLVHAALDAGITVVPIPGPVAFATALSASGLPTDDIRFGGFLPAKSGQRRRALEDLRGESATVAFYETPHRLLDALDDIDAVLGDRPVVVARELTKLHEEFLRGTAASIRAALAGRPGGVKGEITLLIGKATHAVVDDSPVEAAVAALEASGIPRMDAIKQIARERGLPKRDVYRLVTE
ncbi:MAG: 16S rRNA (cytidine(1402)-2'-O)-methyltransferase [Bryobacteraceae bacterium]